MGSYTASNVKSLKSVLAGLRQRTTPSFECISTMFSLPSASSCLLIGRHRMTTLTHSPLFAGKGAAIRNTRQQLYHSSILFYLEP
mmetsp:Transcript_16735/g.29884  ORF Transcript_16735/g.29884 Transcript_16735/m.29884 type:complete len:85 (-) Transcript_16735:19-273(-)